MADSGDEDALLVTFAVTSVAAAAATFMLDAAATTRQRKRRHRVWLNKYLQRLAQYGTYAAARILWVGPSSQSEMTYTVSSGT